MKAFNRALKDDPRVERDPATYLRRYLSDPLEDYKMVSRLDKYIANLV